MDTHDSPSIAEEASIDCMVLDGSEASETPDQLQEINNREAGRPV
jgi:hypothetical protein